MKLYVNIVVTIQIALHVVNGIGNDNMSITRTITKRILHMVYCDSGEDLVNKSIFVGSTAMFGPYDSEVIFRELCDQIKTIITDIRHSLVTKYDIVGSVHGNFKFTISDLDVEIDSEVATIEITYTSIMDSPSEISNMKPIDGFLVDRINEMLLARDCVVSYTIYINLQTGDVLLDKNPNEIPEGYYEWIMKAHARIGDR